MDNVPWSDIVAVTTTNPYIAQWREIMARCGVEPLSEDDGLRLPADTAPEITPRRQIIDAMHEEALIEHLSIGQHDD